jgi:hypothetical protein
MRTAASPLPRARRLFAALLALLAFFAASAWGPSREEWERLVRENERLRVQCAPASAQPAAPVAPKPAALSPTAKGLVLSYKLPLPRFLYEEVRFDLGR